MLLSTPLVLKKKDGKRSGGMLGLFASRDGGQSFARAGDGAFISSVRYPRGALTPDTRPGSNGYTRFALAPMLESADGSRLILFSVEDVNSLTRQPRLLRFEVPRGRLGSLAPNKKGAIARARTTPRLACGGALRVLYAPMRKSAKMLEIRVVDAIDFDFANSSVLEWNATCALVAWPGSPIDRILGTVVRLEMRFSGMRLYGFEWVDEASREPIPGLVELTRWIATDGEPWLPTKFARDEMILNGGSSRVPENRKSVIVPTRSDRGVEAGVARLAKNGKAYAFEPAPNRAPLAASWELLPDFPRGGIESLGLAMLDSDTLMAVGGFCGGVGFGSYNCKPRGFRSETWLLDLEAREWSRGSDFPGEARQGQTCASVNGSAYCFGGFTYKPLSGAAAANPAALRRKKMGVKITDDAYKLISVSGKRERAWKRLRDPPIACARSALTVSAFGVILLVGGATFDGAWWDVSRCGRAIQAFDTRTERWRTMKAELPGPGRMIAAAAVLGDDLYVFGGVVGGDGLESKYVSALDNFVVNLVSGRARALPTSPWSCRNHFNGALWRDRYILMSGGATYQDSVRRGNRDVQISSRANFFGCHASAYPLTTNSVFRDIIVYDLIAETFTNSHALRKPVALNEGFILWKDSIISVGGEGEQGRKTIAVDGVDYSGRHSRITLLGTLRFAK